MKEIQLGDKFTLKLARASFTDALALKRLVLKKVKVGDISLDNIDPSNIQDIAQMDTGSDFFKSVIAQVMLLEADEEIEQAILKCAKKSTINNEKITFDLFEDVELWPHLLDLKVEVLKYNLSPFFKGVLSSFERLMK